MKRWNKMNRVLFVDDKEELLALIDKKLKDEEYEKVFATSAQEALKILDEQEIDVLITDMLMPDVSGMQLLQVVNEKQPNLVKIVLSGHAQVPVIIKAINEGKIYKYISKPWRINEESKQLIRDALKHAKALKAACSCINEQGLMISFETVETLIGQFASQFAIVEANKMVRFSEKLTQCCDMTQLMENPNNYFVNHGYQYIALNPQVSLYYL